MNKAKENNDSVMPNDQLTFIKSKRGIKNPEVSRFVKPLS